MSQAPKDQAVRDRFIRERHRNAVVEAGAGTGKTTLVVKRICALVLGTDAAPGGDSAQGTEVLPLARIAAITFTDASATELRNRVRDALSTARLDALQASDSRTFSLANAAIADLEQASISTIHGFCQTILRENALDAGLDPSFEVLEAGASLRLIEEVFDLWFDEMGSDPAVRRALAFGIQPQLLEERAREFLRLGPEVLDAERFLAPSPRGADGPIVDLMRTAAQLLETYGPHLGTVPALVGKRLHNQLLVMRAMLEDHAALLGEEATDDDWTAFEMQLMQERFRTGRPGGGSPDGGHWAKLLGGKAGEHNDRSVEFADQIVAVRAAIGQHLIAELEPPLLAFRQHYEDAKERRAVVDFDDLLVRAEKLVRLHPSVRRHLFERFQTLFVDEFQDTDPVQARLVFFLAGGPGTEGQMDWTQITPAPGRLVLMGDPKQSIYRFRKADVETYRKCCALVQAADADAAYTINTNFRTDGELVHFVNEVFTNGAGKMQAPDDGDYQAEYIGLEPQHATRGVARPVVALVQPEGDEVRGSDVNVKREAAATVAFVQAHLAEWGRTLGDVAILGRTRSALRPYADALAHAGIDFLYEGKRSLLESREALEALNLLQAIVDTSHETAVVGALRSIWFGVDDNALVRHKLAGGSWSPLDALQADAAGDPQVLEGLRQLGEWAARADAPDALIASLMFDGWMAGLLRLRQNGAQAVMDLERLGGYLLELMAEQGLSLAAAVRTCQNLVRTESDVSAAQLLASDAVRLMTVHKSKGLEFGIVVLAHASGQPKNSGGDSVFLDDGRLVWRLNAGFAHPDFETKAKSEKPRDEAEALRVLYVALTRAKHHLVVPLFAAVDGRSKAPKLLRDRLGKGVFGKRLVSAFFPEDESLMPGFATRTERVDGSPPPTPTRPPVAAWQPELSAALQNLAVQTENPAALRARALAAREPLWPMMFGPSRVADQMVHASETAQHAAPETGGQAEFGFETPQTVPALESSAVDLGVAARQIGTLVHECIEHRLDDAATRRQAQSAGLASGDVDFVVRCVAVERDLPSHARAFAAGADVFDELPVMWGGLSGFPGAETLLMNAFIDRLIRYPDGTLEIVDFKTDRMDPEAPDFAVRLAAQTEHHMVQLGLYGLALEAAGLNVTDLTLAFLVPGQDVTRRFDDSLRAQASAALQNFAAPPPKGAVR